MREIFLVLLCAVAIGFILFNWRIVRGWCWDLWIFLQELPGISHMSRWWYYHPGRLRRGIQRLEQDLRYVDPAALDLDALLIYVKRMDRLGRRLEKLYCRDVGWEPWVSRYNELGCRLEPHLRRHQERLLRERQASR